ncbi:hypothetical protein [Chryseobacterium sp. MFBS3-17]|uniref:hypothetical protein n=1 Tax=Chryseobacterium sp. MFBS3-17 TaxID=2886689 RepID=UPI001D0E6BB5|nr:hypothetical protein [Chryseobacterium sp. MFBS3-17]MCC2590963.1 hypothetical protein [Chryseobacterium sp. MFBS3-17]
MSTIQKPAPVIAPEIVEELRILPVEEKQVIIHCCFPAEAALGSLIRIWPSTFLVDEVSGSRSRLVHAENISFTPMWTEVPPFRDYWFTLIFEGLPADCKQFDLQEMIAEEGGFFVQNIRRNQTDVYRVRV